MSRQRDGLLVSDRWECIQRLEAILCTDLVKFSHSEFLPLTPDLNALPAC